MEEDRISLIFAALADPTRRAILARLAEVKEKIASLMALQAELERMVDGCSHGRVETCKVIDILADHGQCRHHKHEAAV